MIAPGNRREPKPEHHDGSGFNGAGSDRSRKWTGRGFYITTADADIVSAGPVDAKHVQLNVQPTPGGLARALDALLRYCTKHKHNAKGRGQLRNVVSIARVCVPLQVDPLARVFNVVEKGLKGLGDKRLVLEIAEISIQACQRQPRGTQEVEWEAQAIICGVSWAYQRLGQLEDARSAAEKSLRLGEQIGYERNSAFCHKCIGRLYRIMGFRTEAGQQYWEQLLKEAEQQVAIEGSGC